MSYDAIIIGGSYAGLSAALQLARARRKILVVDAGERRNRFAAHAHGFLTRDGTDPSEIQRIGREQLLAYPTVTWREDRVVEAEGFTLTLASGDRVTGSRLVIAVGMIDELPAIPGVAERWGGAVFTCPYCHAYELGGEPIAVIATHPMSHHAAMLLPDWGPTTFFTRGLFVPDAEVTAGLVRRNVTIDHTPIERIANHADVVLADGRALSFAGISLFTQPRIPPAGREARARARTESGVRDRPDRWHEGDIGARRVRVRRRRSRAADDRARGGRWRACGRRGARVAGLSLGGTRGSCSTKNRRLAESRSTTIMPRCKRHEAHRSRRTHALDGRPR